MTRFGQAIDTGGGTAISPYTLDYTKEIGRVSILSEDDWPTSVFMSNDGSKMFMSGIQNDPRTYEYSLGTDYDASTASFVRSLDTSGQGFGHEGVSFSPSGSEMFIADKGSSDILTYSLSTSWDLSTASFSSKLDVGTNANSPTGLAWGSNGGKLYVCTTSAVHTYDPGSSYTADSNASYVSTFDTSPYDGGIQEVTFNDSGSQMILLSDLKAGAMSFTLGTPWDVSTASASRIYYRSGSPIGISWAQNGGVYVRLTDEDVITYKIGHEVR